MVNHWCDNVYHSHHKYYAYSDDDDDDDYVPNALIDELKSQL
jgi:hypothetical protein